MSKYGKKVTLSEKEKDGILLGSISSYKRTNTYGRALKVYKSECEQLARAGYKLLTSTRLWFDQKESCIKMLFVVEIGDKKIIAKENIKKMFDDFALDGIFKDFSKVFGKNWCEKLSRLYF